jgi:hypothetical protein
MRTKLVLAAAFVFAVVSFAMASPDQPNMQAARADLGTAKRELQRATANKGGHRAKAIGLINSAIAEVNAGIEYDRRHNHAGRRLGLADQPHMAAALAALESAKNNLERATGDKGGHRKRAIELVKDAISEVKKGINAAR